MNHPSLQRQRHKINIWNWEERPGNNWLAQTAVVRLHHQRRFSLYPLEARGRLQPVLGSSLVSG